MLAWIPRFVLLSVMHALDYDQVLWNKSRGQRAEDRGQRTEGKYSVQYLSYVLARISEAAKVAWRACVRACVRDDSHSSRCGPPGYQSIDAIPHRLPYHSERAVDKMLSVLHSPSPLPFAIAIRHRHSPSLSPSRSVICMI